MHILEHLQCKMSNQFTESIKTFEKKIKNTKNGSNCRACLDPCCHDNARHVYLIMISITVPNWKRGHDIKALLQELARWSCDMSCDIRCWWLDTQNTITSEMSYFHNIIKKTAFPFLALICWSSIIFLLDFDNLGEIWSIVRRMSMVEISD